MNSIAHIMKGFNDLHQMYYEPFAELMSIHIPDKKVTAQYIMKHRFNLKIADDHNARTTPDQLAAFKELSKNWN